MTCQATTKSSGRRCSKDAGDSGYCHLHDPARADVREACRQGGKARAAQMHGKPVDTAAADEAGEPIAQLLESGTDQATICAALVQIAAATIRGDIAEKRANAAGFALSIAVKYADPPADDSSTTAELAEELPRDADELRLFEQRLRDIEVA